MNKKINLSFCSASELSNYIISKIDFISNLKLQKILYFCQIRVLIEFDKPLFDEDIESWSFGPVVPSIYNKYRMFGASSIPKFNIQENLLIPLTTVHNYIDTDSMILRKGSVSAQKGEILIIPINMRDGNLICIGKGNEDWNFSAPHGAGRLMSRAKAKKSFTVSEFKKQMSGIYTTSVNSSTLDECPMAYKDINSILENIEPTVETKMIIKPIYNFKAGE